MWSQLAAGPIGLGPIGVGPIGVGPIGIGITIVGPIGVDPIGVGLLWHPDGLCHDMQMRYMWQNNSDCETMPEIVFKLRRQ